MEYHLSMLITHIRSVLMLRPGADPGFGNGGGGQDF